MNHESWPWFPTAVEVNTAADGQNYEFLAKIGMPGHVTAITAEFGTKPYEIPGLSD